MLASSDRREITAREIQERHEEKLLALGPVLSRLDQEFLDPVINRTFAICARKQLFPPPPRELENVDLKVHYVSIMAQAQKAVSLSGIDRLVTSAMEISKVQPDVLDKIDFDQVIDELADTLGTPAKVTRSDDATKPIRAQRQKMQQAQQRTEMGATMAKSAKDLAASPTDQKNALTDALSAIQAGANN